MFLGAFNAGCGHMTRQDKANIRLFSNPGFFWLIGDKVDTTVGDLTSCAYDRWVEIRKWATLKLYILWMRDFFDYRQSALMDTITYYCSALLTWHLVFLRIVVHGQPFLKAIKPYSARVFNIAKEYKLSKEMVILFSNNILSYFLAFQTLFHLKKPPGKAAPCQKSQNCLCIFLLS